MLDVVIKGRNRGIKEWEFQELSGMGQEILSGSRSVENGSTSYTYMEYGFFPPGRIQLRRNRKIVKKQVCTMATVENDDVFYLFLQKQVSSGGDWYISLWTADAKVWVQKNGSVSVVSEGV
jgi:hypothetical protein